MNYYLLFKESDGYKNSPALTLIRASSYKIELMLIKTRAIIIFECILKYIVSPLYTAS